MYMVRWPISEAKIVLLDLVTQSGLSNAYDG